MIIENNLLSDETKAIMWNSIRAKAIAGTLHDNDICPAYSYQLIGFNSQIMSSTIGNFIERFPIEKLLDINASEQSDKKPKTSNLKAEDKLQSIFAYPPHKLMKYRNEINQMINKCYLDEPTLNHEYLMQIKKNLSLYHN